MPLRRLLSVLVMLPWLASVQASCPPPVSVCTHVISSTAGSDSGAGTLASPWRSIEKGARETTAGETLCLRAGTYGPLLSSAHTINSGTSFADAPRFLAYEGETVIVPNLNLSTGVSPARHHIIFEGIIFDGMAISPRVREVIYLGNGAHHIRLLRCEVKNADAHGILGPGHGAGSNEFLEVNVHHNGTRPTLDHGLYMGSAANRIEDSVFHHNANSGIHIYNGGVVTAHNQIIRRNTVTNNGVLAPGSSAGIVLSDSHDSIIEDNTVNDNTGGITTDKTDDTEIMNNRVCRNTPGYGIHVHDDSTDTSVHDNVINGNAGEAIRNDAGAETTTANNNTTNPALCNP